jgi:putative hemolysin
MDWGVDEKGNAHPGGPFYQGDLHIVLCIRDSYKKTALNPPTTLQQDDATEKSSEPIVEKLPVEESKEDSKEDSAIDSAQAFCLQRGNIYENGFCTFPGGTSCDAWDFYRGDCILTGKRR